MSKDQTLGSLFQEWLEEDGLTTNAKKEQSVKQESQKRAASQKPRKENVKKKRVGSYVMLL